MRRLQPLSVPPDGERPTGGSIGHQLHTRVHHRKSEGPRRGGVRPPQGRNRQPVPSQEVVKHRMVAATLSLGGFFLALYLWLWKIGVIGQIACGAGTCEYVQTSSYATFLGLPVALIGVGGYLSLLVVSLVGLQPRWI